MRTNKEIMDFVNNRVKNFGPYLLNNEYDDVKWLNLLAAMHNLLEEKDKGLAQDIMNYHYMSIVDLYSQIDDLNTKMRNLAALIAEK